MNNSQGALYFGAGIDMAQWRNNIQEMRRDILGLNTQTQVQTRQMDNSFKNLSTAVAGYFSVSMLSGFIHQVINIRGEFQKTEIAFGTMLRSQSAAKDLMAQMVDLAATTPFSLQDVSNGAKQLLAFQIPANEVVDVLTRMGNIAAGLGVPLSRINLVYGQVKAKGKLMGDDLRQFTEAGIPMVAELAKKFNTSTAAITEMVSAGKIGFKDVQDVLFSMTNEGGMFFNLMEKQSKSLSGQVSNLGDSWDQMLNKIGEGNEGILSDGISALNYLVENYETVIEIIGIAVTAYGVYKAALIATVTWQRLSALASYQQALSQGVLTTAQSYGTAAAILLRNAHASLNATMVANPLGLVIGLIAGLSYVIYKNVTATTAYIDLQEKLNNSTRSHSESLIEQKAKIESLIKVIKDKNTSDETAKKALNQINSLTGERIKGLTIEGIRLGENTKAISGYVQMLEKEARAKALIDTIIAAEKKEKEILANPYSKLSWGDEFGNYRDAGDILKDPFTRKREAQIEDLQGVWKVKIDSQKELNKLIQEGVKTEETANGTNNMDGGASGWASRLKEQIKALDDAIDNAPTKQLAQKLAAKKAVLEKELASINPSKDKNEAQIAEYLPLGSIKELERRASLIEQAVEVAINGQVKLRKLDKYGKDTDKKGNPFLTGEIISPEEAKKRVDAINEQIKKLRVKSFDEEITETKRQIEVRDKLLKSGYSKEIVDEMFPEVKDKSFIQYLNEMGLALEKLEGKNAAENLIKLQQVLNDYTGAETFIENVNKQIDELKSKFSGDELLDKLDKFKKANVEGTTGDERNAKNIAIAKAEKDELERQKKVYKDFLKEKETFEKKKKDIDDKYNAIDSAINGSNNSADEKARLLIESGKARGKEYSEAFLSTLKDTNLWQKAFGDIALMTNREIKKNIDNLKLKLREATANGATADEIKIIQDRIKELQGILNTNPFEKIAISFKILGDETATTAQKLDAAKALFIGIGEGVQMIGDSFGGFSEETQQVVNDIMAIGTAAFDMAKSIATGDIAGMIQSGIKLLGSIAQALNGDKKKERNIKRQAAVLKELEMQYNALAFAAERAFGAQKYDGQRDLIKSLEQQKIAIEGMMRLEQSKKKGDKEKIADYQNQIQGINQSITTLKEGIIKDVLQTDIPDMASKLGDALLDAFSKGESGVDAINRAFDDLVKNMLKNQLNKILEGQMGPVIARMRSAMGFNEDGSGTFDGLTPEEIAELRAIAQAATAQGQQFIEAYGNIFEGLDSPAEGLKGDIKGITEKTAGALEAQINAIRIYQVEAITIHRNNQAVFLNCLNTLAQIEVNTRRLHSIDDGIQALLAKSRGLAGLG